MPTTILLVDPDPKIHNDLASYIEESAYQLICVFSAKQALMILEQGHVDLIMTELYLPDMSGFLFLNQVKDVPCLMVYSQQSHQEAVIRAFEEGADDFIVKATISIKELFLRMQAILKRRIPSQICVKNIQLDIQSQGVWWNGVELEFNRQHFRFLLDLVRHPNTIRSRERLLEVISNEDYRILYVIAYTLRQQIEVDPCHPQHILNVRGVGYMFKI